MPELPLPGRGAVRPGAMTTAMRAVGAGDTLDPWVRAAVVRDGAIVEERWVRPGAALTWGRSERADVVVADGPQAAAALVTSRDGRFEIALGGAVAGRLVSGGATLDLAEQARAGARSIALASGARARIELGEITVLLELARRPPRPRRAPPPLALGPIFGTDGPFTAAAIGSLVLHAIFVVGLSEHDWPAALRPRIAEVVFIEPDMPPIDPRIDEPTDAPTSEDATETPSDDASESAPIADARPAPRAPSPSAADIASFRDEIARDVDLQIGALADGGALDDLLRGSTVTTTSAELMADVRATGEASLDPRAGTMPAMRDGAPLAMLQGDHGTRLEVHRTGAAGEGSGPGPERMIPAPAPQQIEIDDPAPGFDPTTLARAIRGRMGAVRACYEHALRQHPDLAGRIELEMRVERVGTLSGVHVRAGSIGDDALHDCVERAVRTIRLTAGPDDATTVSFPFVLAPQQ
jgi:hypothetical protein